MKLLLFSDNHRDREAVNQVLQKNPNLDRYISLGDSEMKESELTKLDIFGVKGNYPYEPKFPKELTFVLEGTKVYLTHGHLFSVKMGLKRLLNYGIYNDINVICFGHTHRPLLKEIQGIIFINPGTLCCRKIPSKCSYALLEITDKNIDVIIKTLEGEVLLKYTKQR
ncbi:metallophosphoesterase [Mycoplasmatota bacterium WC30]